MGIRKKLKKLLPYWLADRDQQCAACDARHAHAVEVRCVACDLAHCTFCVVTVEGEMFCVTCQPGEGGS